MGSPNRRDPKESHKSIIKHKGDGISVPGCVWKFRMCNNQFTNNYQNNDFIFTCIWIHYKGNQYLKTSAELLGRKFTWFKKIMIQEFSSMYRKSFHTIFINSSKASYSIFLRQRNCENYMEREINKYNIKRKSIFTTALLDGREKIRFCAP